MPKKPSKRQQGDPWDRGAWSEPALGEDSTKPKREPGAPQHSGLVTRIAETFWRECDTIPLSVPRWSNRPRMNKNITFILGTHSEEVIKASFMFFRSESPSLNLGPDNACWDAYFRRRGSYLRSAERAMEGRRAGQAVRMSGDIVVDNRRFQGRSPGDATDTDDITGEDDQVS